MFLFATLLQMISYYRDPHGNKMMKDLTGAHSVKLQKSGFVQSGTAEQEKTASLEQRVAELEGELKRYKASKQKLLHTESQCYSLTGDVYKFEHVTLNEFMSIKMAKNEGGGGSQSGL